ncbi:tyrosine-type recombinase/integrase [Gottfriedia acidiceleris]|uniref:tyrosine-type recombinase/integrase n=1 Tax=Gottfriedia acidiceleris TaxID=371036 RepID=UPI00101DDDE4|nr:tyrosine-type recombinase/integrase [Gottfriedia acidiceleris]
MTYTHYEEVTLNSKGEVPAKIRKIIEAEYIKFSESIATGEYIEPSRNKKLTFEKFAMEWFEKVAISELKPNTIKMHESNLKSRLIPKFGKMYLDEITVKMISDYVHDLSKEGSRLDGKKGPLSKGSIKMIVQVIKSIFQYAVSLEEIRKDPTVNIKVKLNGNKTNVPYSASEVQQLLSSLQSEPFIWQVYIELALNTGARRGELTGLEWKHVNWEEKTLSIEQTLSFSKNGQPIITDPKSNSGIRIIPLNDDILSILKVYRDEQVRTQYTKNWLGGDYRFIFCHQDGRGFHQDRPTAWFKKFLKRHDLRSIRLHDLRHSVATALFQKNVPVKYVSAILGHSSTAITQDIYSHILKESHSMIAEELGNAFNNKKAYSK